MVEPGDAIEQLAELLNASGAKITFDSGRNINNPCTFCGEAKGPYKLMDIGTYFNGNVITRPVCPGCAHIAEAHQSHRK